MYTNMFTYVIILLLAAIAANASGVNEITAANYDELVKNSNNVWILEFYSPTCPYCQDFAPEYEEVGRELEGSDIKVGRIDAVHNDAIAAENDIRGYPTVKFFQPHGAYSEVYNGPRSASMIADVARSFAHGKRVRSFGDAYLNLPQTRRIPSSAGSSGYVL